MVAYCEYRGSKGSPRPRGRVRADVRPSLLVLVLACARALKRE